MTPSHVDSELVGAGLVKDPSSIAALGPSYDLAIIGSKWKIHASVPRSYDSVDLGLMLVVDLPPPAMRGPRHRVTTDAALTASLAPIVAALQGIAVNESTITCPKCKVRWVRVFERSRMNKPVTPFLGCDGAAKLNRNHQWDCDGKLHGMTPIVSYP